MDAFGPWSPRIAGQVDWRTRHAPLLQCDGDTGSVVAADVDSMWTQAHQERGRYRGQAHQARRPRCNRGRSHLSKVGLLTPGPAPPVDRGDTATGRSFALSPRVFHKPGARNRAMLDPRSAYHIFH